MPTLFEGLKYLLNGYTNQIFINKIAKRIITSKEMEISFFFTTSASSRESSTIGFHLCTIN